MDASTLYDVDIGPGGALRLLEIIADGVACAKEREQRLERGDFTEEDVKGRYSDI